MSLTTYQYSVGTYVPFSIWLAKSNNAPSDELIPPRPTAPPLPEVLPPTPKKPLSWSPLSRSGQKSAFMSPPQSPKTTNPPEEDVFHASFSKISLSEPKRQKRIRNIKTAAELLGPNFKTTLKKQGSIRDCYLVAAFDAMTHSPIGTSLLNQIQIEETQFATLGNDLLYTVRFPSGLTGKVLASEVGKKRNDKAFLEGHWIWQMLELAYAKATRNERNQKRINPFADDGRGYTPLILEGGIPKDALHDMFGGEPEQITSEDNMRLSDTRIDCFSKNPNGYKSVVTFLHHVAEDIDSHHILTASAYVKPSDADHTQQGLSTSGQESHAYSIRDFHIDKNSEKSTITLADPRDLETNYTLTLENFCKVFWRISGVQLPVKSTPREERCFSSLEKPTPFRL